MAMRRESLAVLSRDYGVEDLEDLLEVIMIDAHNERVMSKRRDE